MTRTSQRLLSASQDALIWVIWSFFGKFFLITCLNIAGSFYQLSYKSRATLFRENLVWLSISMSRPKIIRWHLIQVLLSRSGRRYKEAWETCRWIRMLNSSILFPSFLSCYFFSICIYIQVYGKYVYNVLTIRVKYIVLVYLNIIATTSFIAPSSLTDRWTFVLTIRASLSIDDFLESA